MERCLKSVLSVGDSVIAWSNMVYWYRYEAEENHCVELFPSETNLAGVWYRKCAHSSGERT